MVPSAGRCGMTAVDLPKERPRRLVASGVAAATKPTGPTAPRLLAFEAVPDPFTLPTLEWHAKGLWARPTHGQAAGPEKSLKSYVTTAFDVGLAAGLPVLGRFAVPDKQRALIVVGEGGRTPFLRRLERICTAYGITTHDLVGQLRFTCQTAPAGSELFRDSLQAELQSFQPDLVHIDPWYAVASGNVDARNVYDVGAALASLGELVDSGGASLLINNHFNQTGTGGGLRRISMAGHAEWCDSWMLLDHRVAPDVANGRFRLKLDVGSRQWGGGSYHVDFDIGRFDVDRNEHIGDITWEVRHAAAEEVSADDRNDQRVAQAKELLVKTWTKRKKPTPLTKTEWCDLTTGIAKALKVAAFAELVDEGRILSTWVLEVNARDCKRKVEKFVYRKDFEAATGGSEDAP